MTTSTKNMLLALNTLQPHINDEENHVLPINTETVNVESRPQLMSDLLNLCLAQDKPKNSPIS